MVVQYVICNWEALWLRKILIPLVDAKGGVLSLEP